MGASVARCLDEVGDAPVGDLFVLGRDAGRTMHVEATDAPGSAGRAWHDELIACVSANTTAGGVVVPVQP